MVLVDRLERTACGIMIPPLCHRVISQPQAHLPMRENSFQQNYGRPELLGNSCHKALLQKFGFRDGHFATRSGPNSRPPLRPLDAVYSVVSKSRWHCGQVELRLNRFPRSGRTMPTGSNSPQNGQRMSFETP